MKQVLQFLDSGRIQVQEVPAPSCGPGEVLIANEASVISSGTEKMIREMARMSLLEKARARPDQVRKVLKKVKEEGVMDTFRQVKARLAEPLALGYSSAGMVLEAGSNAGEFRPGDRVASNGAHAEVVAVPKNLVAKIPDDVSLQEASYAVIGAVALHGIRLAQIELGERVAVIGLGLVGQLTVQLLIATGCRVLATDPNPHRCALAQRFGSEIFSRKDFQQAIRELTSGKGADAVIITASTSSNDPLELAASVARKKARIVCVGSIGMNAPRREFYASELEMIVSSSYGPGRYDPSYEQRGIDYPFGYVRWTEQRNIAAVLEQIAQKRLQVEPLTTHTFPIQQAEKAYELIEQNEEPFLGIALKYDPLSISSRKLVLSSSAPVSGKLGVGFVGAGNFASLVLLPELKRSSSVRLRSICSAHGVNAAVQGERHGFELACTEATDLFSDASVDAVFIATRHHLHVSQAVAALKHGKHVFVEKPLAIDFEQLEIFESSIQELAPESPLWTIGFNRSFSESARLVFEFFSCVTSTCTLSYRFNVGSVPSDHWTNDPTEGGGRLVGEACHGIDLACYLLRSQVNRVYAESTPGLEDQVVITLRFQNGSVASIGYFCEGDPGIPKERVEVFGGGKAAIIDDFQSITLSESGSSRRHRMKKRDKGHTNEIAAFVHAVQNGGPPPIPYSRLLNVSHAILAAVESLRAGQPVAVPVYSE